MYCQGLALASGLCIPSCISCQAFMTGTELDRYILSGIYDRDRAGSLYK